MTSDQFRQYRIDLKLTQEALGEIMGMPARTISRIEYGARQPTNIQAAFIRHLINLEGHRVFGCSRCDKRKQDIRFKFMQKDKK